jgi:hypothetical protein
MECEFKIGDRVRVRDVVSDEDVENNRLKRTTTYEVIGIESYPFVDMLKVKDWDDSTAEAFSHRFEKVEDQKEEFKMTVDPNYKIREGDKLLIEVEAVKCVPSGDKNNAKGWVEDSTGMVSITLKYSDDQGITKQGSFWIKRDQIIEVKRREFKEGDRVRIGTYGGVGRIVAIYSNYAWIQHDNTPDKSPLTYDFSKLKHES